MPSENYLRVSRAYNELSEMTPKERYKKIHTVAFMAENALKTAKEADEIAFYAEIFKKAGKPLLVGKAKSREYELKGITDIKTVRTKLGTVGIESGLIAVGDPALGCDVNIPYSTEEVQKHIKEGRYYCVGTEGDGLFDVVIRLVDIGEPLISPKEFKFIRMSTPISMLKVVSGRIRCCDFASLSVAPNEGVGYDIENGFYKVAFYAKNFGIRFNGYVVVLARSDKWAEPDPACYKTL